MQQPANNEKAPDGNAKQGAAAAAPVPSGDPTRPGKANAFMPMYIGDMLRDTTHLTAAEFGSYHLLLYRYWSTMEPLADDDDTLMRVARCRSKAEWKRTRKTLSEFFTVTEGVWRHKRVDAELAKAARSAERRRLAGRLGNEVRWGGERKSHGDRNAMPKPSQSKSEPESEPQPGRVAYSSNVPASGGKKAETELMRRCLELLGEAEMAKNGGLWRKRAREDADKLSRTLNDLAAQLKEGRTIDNPPGYLTDLFRYRFASHKQEEK